MAVKQIFKRVKTKDVHITHNESNVHTTFNNTDNSMLSVLENIKTIVENENVKVKKNKEKKNSNTMTIEELANAEAIAKQFAPEVKVVKKDRGLIERTESSKIVLTEDNRQVLSD